MSMLIKWYDKISILNIFKWFGILLPILHVLFLFSSDYRSHYTGVFGVLGWIVMELLFLFISFCLIYFVVGKKSKCSACKKPFSLKETNRDIISKENVSVLVENKTRNRNGDVTGTTEQYVPGIRTTYKITYTCKRCGNVTYKTYSESTPTV